MLVSKVIVMTRRPRTDFRKPILRSQGMTPG
jgi:hypothetical protein